VPIFGDKREGQCFIREGHVIDGSAKLDRAPEEPLQLSTVRIDCMAERYMRWMNVPARDLAQRFDHRRQSKFGVVSHTMP
jgi:hypothetical protein